MRESVIAIPGATRRLLLLLTCLILAGCSSTRIAYNQMDWFLVWYISDYFSLEDEQQDELKVIVQRNLDWHRQDQLPKYIELLREIQTQNATRQLDQERLDYFFSRFMLLWDEFLVQVTPEATTILVLLNQEQLDKFIEKMEESNQELWDEYAGQTVEERQKNRTKAAIKGIEKFYGRLNREQKDLIRTYMSQLHDVSEDWIAGRRLWQQAFRNLIVESPPEPEFTTRMFNLMLDPNQFDSAEYRYLVDQNRRHMQVMTVDLNQTLTDKQHKKLDKRVEKLIRNFEILSLQGT